MTTPAPDPSGRTHDHQPNESGDSMTTPDAAPTAVEVAGYTLTSAQRDAAEMLQSCERAAASQRAYLHRLRDELRVLEEVLPLKRASVERAEKDYEDTRAILRESFGLYRDLMGMER